MKAGKKTFLAGILAVVMIASSSITVLAAETSQTPQENLQSITQQDEQTTEKKVRKTEPLPPKGGRFNQRLKPPKVG